MSKQNLLIIYQWSKQNLRLKKGEFYHTFLPAEFHSQFKSLVDDCRFTSKRLESQFKSGKYDLLIKKQLNEFVQTMLPSKYRMSFINMLVEYLLAQQALNCRQFATCIAIKQLQNRQQIPSAALLNEIIYDYFMLSLRDELPKLVNALTHYDYAEDRAQFIEAIIDVVGVNCGYGHTLAYQMADDGNVYALNEVANIAYYGRNGIAKKNIQTAYDYIEKAYLLKKWHPVVLLSLAYLIAHYHSKDADMITTRISQLQRMTKEEQINLCFTSLRYACLSQDGRAYWMLAQIRVKRLLILEKAVDYFYCGETYHYLMNRAIELGYWPALYDCAKWRLAKAKAATGQNRLKYYRQYYRYLQRAADKLHLAALYELACLQREGVRCGEDILVERDRTGALQYYLSIIENTNLYDSLYRQTYLILIEEYFSDEAFKEQLEALNIFSPHFIQRVIAAEENAAISDKLNSHLIAIKQRSIH